MKRTFFILLFALLSCLVFAQTPVFVNHAATGANNGTSWANAYTDLQTAIDSAAAGSELWVAAGIYTPTQKLFNGTFEEDKTFLITKSLRLYGGFIGTETARAQRQTSDTTTLSGRLDASTQAWHVLSILVKDNDSVTIDRFKITEGSSSSGGYSPQRIVIPPSLRLDSAFVEFSSFADAAIKAFAQNQARITLSDNYITRNSSPSLSINAVGLHAVDSAFIGVYNNQFVGNAGSGCMAMTGRDVFSTTEESYIEVVSNRFVANVSLFEGGGLLVLQGKVLVEKNHFNDNEAKNGGGMSIFDSYYIRYYIRYDPIFGAITVSNNMFENNSAEKGGGVHIDSNVANARLVFTDNQLIENSAMYDGGGMVLNIRDTTFNLEIANNGFLRNESGRNGGGISITSFPNNTIVHNNLFSANRAVNGGGIYHSDSYSQKTLLFTENTITGNHASRNGGGVYSYDGLFLNNSITHNTAVVEGGGITLSGTQAVMKNNLVASNIARRYGGIFAMTASNKNGEIALTNNTIVANYADTVGGLYIYSTGYATRIGVIKVSNNLIWGNDDNFQYQNIGIIQLNNNMMEEITAATLNAFGANNIDGTTANTHAITSLIFADYDGGDYRPAGSSIAINSASNALYRAHPIYGDSVDLDGNRRFLSTAIDLGAYEYQEPVVATAQVLMVTVNGIPLLDRPTTRFLVHYQGNCDEGSFHVRIWISNLARLSIPYDTTITIDALAGLDSLFFLVSAQNGATTSHLLVLEKRFDFDLVVTTLWQTNTFMLDIAKLQREGFDFTYDSPYQWYRNGEPIYKATLPTYSAGPYDVSRLDAGSAYHLAMTRRNGEVLHTCVKHPTETTPAGVALYPNPATAGLPFSIVLEGINSDEPLQATIYNSLGQVLTQQTMTSHTLSMSLPLSGVYLLVINNGQQERIAETKIIVKK